MSHPAIKIFVGPRKSWNIEKRQKIENLYKLMVKIFLTKPILINTVNIHKGF